VSAPKTTLSSTARRDLLARLDAPEADFRRRYPGEGGRRQPVHVFYGGAHLFRADSARRLGELALDALDRYAPDPGAFAGALDLDGLHAVAVYDRVREKLRREPVEDLRIDFEDGYGNRPDEEEDAHAAAAAGEAAAGMAAGSLPPFLGIRLKPLTAQWRERSLRTLDIFLTTLVEATGGRLPDGFVVTLAKITFPQQVSALVDAFEQLEGGLQLAPGALKLEIMIETTQALLGENGASALGPLLDAARGRCRGAHFGAYDYTAACDITAANQLMTHPACDFARQTMRAALAGTGVRWVDGGTNILPTPVHRGVALTPAQLEENRAAVGASWKLHFGHIRRSLADGFYQGWDLHPAQLPSRFAAVYSFFLEGLEDASARLRNLNRQAAQATRLGAVFDDAATGLGLLTYFRRALDCGAITGDEAAARTELPLDVLTGVKSILPPAPRPSP